MSSLFELKDNDITIDMSTIIKNCKICHEIDLLKKWNRKDCKVIFTFTSHKYWKWGDLFCFEMHKNITHVNSWKQSIAQTTVDACSQEYSGTNSLILKKPSWKERGQQKLFWQTRKTLNVFLKCSKPFQSFLGHSRPKILCDFKWS